MSYNCDQQEFNDSSDPTGGQEDPAEQNKQQESQKVENVQGESAMADCQESGADCTSEEMDFEEAKKGLKRQHVTNSDSDRKQTTTGRHQRLHPQPKLSTRKKDGKSVSKSDETSSKSESKSPQPKWFTITLLLSLPKTMARKTSALSIILVMTTFIFLVFRRFDGRSAMAEVH